MKMSVRLRRDCGGRSACTWGAALLVAAGPLGMAQFGFTPVLQRVDLLGAMLVLLVFGSQATLRDGVRAAWPCSTPQWRRPRASALATAK